MISEAQNRKKDTSLLGAQLQELIVRNQKLASTTSQRDDILLEKSGQINLLNERLTKVLAEKKQIEKSKNLVDAQNKALSSVLS